MSLARSTAFLLENGWLIALFVCIFLGFDIFLSLVIAAVLFFAETDLLRCAICVCLLLVIKEPLNDMIGDFLE